MANEPIEGVAEQPKASPVEAGGLPEPAQIYTPDGYGTTLPCKDEPQFRYRQYVKWNEYQHKLAAVSAERNQAVTHRDALLKEAGWPGLVEILYREIAQLKALEGKREATLVTCPDCGNLTDDVGTDGTAKCTNCSWRGKFSVPALEGKGEGARQECKNCGLRIYAQWWHHGSNLEPCYGGRDTFAEPAPIPESPEPKEPLGTCADFPTLHIEGSHENCDMWSHEGAQEPTK